MADREMVEMVCNALLRQDTRPACRPAQQLARLTPRFASARCRCCAAGCRQHFRRRTREGHIVFGGWRPLWVSRAVQANEGTVALER